MLANGSRWCGRCAPRWSGAAFSKSRRQCCRRLAGGAAARPFVTHSNALDADLYLRIAPELFLKRCLVGGFDKVFELNRVFRNEGADSTHSPEFAMLETYQAYGTYDDSAVVTREIIQEVADEAIGTRKLPLPDGTVYDRGRRMGDDTNVSVAV